MDKPLLLVVDDDPLIQDLVSEWFADEFGIVGAHNVSEVKSALQQMPKAPDYALIDLGLPPSPHRPDEGFAVIRLLRAASADCAIVVVSGQDARRQAQRARALGAGEYVEKPCKPETLREKLLSCRRLLDSTRENLGLIGNSSPIQQLREAILQVAPSSFPVLIIGETGTGKELAARALHEKGREGKIFFPVNCAAIPDHLAEPMLFGHAKGAFTGAAQMAGGMLAEAKDGTLFLDEIGDLSASIQGKLLRVIETGEYNRVGETTARQCAARIVAATNRDLGDGQFRRDLYYRISAFTLRMPLLQDMGEDKNLLLEHFRGRVAIDMRASPFLLSPAAQTLWARYTFPGNIRELRNIVARLQVRHGDTEVDEIQLQDQFCADDFLSNASYRRQLQAIAKGWIDGGESFADLQNEMGAAAARYALENSNGDEQQAAKRLLLSTKEFDRLKLILEKLS